MPFTYGLYPDLTVEENIYFYSDIYGVRKKERDIRMNQILKMTQMLPFRERKSGFLSGGMKQKLQLACALIHTPKFLILDEPTFGVDPISRREFWKLLLELLREGITIVVTTSYLDEAQRCNTITLLYEGNVLKQGTPFNISREIPGTMISLHFEKAGSIYSELKSIKGIRNVTSYGDRLHILLEENKKYDEFIKDIGYLNINKDKIEQISASLEDAFIYFVEKKRMQKNE
jgi:ABC-2 type transport system ATP-binding protein